MYRLFCFFKLFPIVGKESIDYGLIEVWHTRPKWRKYNHVVLITLKFRNTHSIDNITFNKLKRTFEKELLASNEL